MSHCLIFANGHANDGLMVRRTLDAAGSPLVIAADGGARLAREFGYHIDLIVGDMDSLPAADLAAFEADGVATERHPPAKDETDLELALHAAVDRDATWIRVIGAVGGRLDQTLANIYLLGLPALQERDVRLVSGKQEVRLLRPGSYPLTGSAGDTVSLIPIGGGAQGIVTGGLHYPLADEALEFGPARGISNVMTGDTAHVMFRSGRLLLIHSLGSA